MSVSGVVGITREQVAEWVKSFPQNPTLTLSHRSALALGIAYIGLLDEIAHQKKEFKIRVHPPMFIERPFEFRGRGRSSAYDCGYFTAWRGDEFKGVYQLSHQVQAECAGYRDGKRDVAQAIGAALSEGL